MTDDDEKRHAELVRRATHLLGQEVAGSADLGGSSRSLVLRLALADGATAIAKQSFADTGEFDRERTGLSLLPRTPEVLAVDAGAKVIVMSDLGQWPTLADLLLGDDREAAWAGALGWAAALGDLVGATVGAPAAAAREALEPGDATPDDEAIQAIRRGCADLAELVGHPVADYRAGLDAATAALSSSSATVLWPGDACPDNAMLTPDGWRFLDLEGASVVPAAFVGAYAALPFATCWCVFDPPPDFTAQMTAEFTAALGKHAPDAVTEPAWSRSVRLAGAAWVLSMTGWLLPRALTDDGPIGVRHSPNRREHLAARWRWLARNLREEAPDLAGLGAAASTWANENWPDAATLPGYPAFAGGGPQGP